MRKLFALFGVLVIVLLVFSIGCSKEEKGKTVTSRPVAAQPAGEPADVEVSVAEAPAEAPASPRTLPAAGQAGCEQLSTDDIAAVFGGTWSKTADCPQRPQMPAGVDVCRCDYDGPKQVYVNVETQLYADSAEAERVYGMYCDASAESAGVGAKSCTATRTSSTRPNYVYFLKGDYFVKVSCLGGTCSMGMIVELAKKVDSSI
ncbi:hypothetical protein JW898_00545 [Candidatus Woesearchaeota archaeon]|nr:hypothetical protein [Candidatus Woesearchaeota archaeon]